MMFLFAFHRWQEYQPRINRVENVSSDRVSHEKSFVSAVQWQTLFDAKPPSKIVGFSDGRKECT